MKVFFYQAQREKSIIVMQISFILYDKSTKKVNKFSLSQPVLTKSMLFPINHSLLVSKSV